MVQNPMGLIHLEGLVCYFDGVSFAVSCFFAIAFGLRLFDLTLPMSMKLDGGAIKLNPRHPLNLNKVDSFVDGVYSPCFGGD